MTNVCRVIGPTKASKGPIMSIKVEKYASGLYGLRWGHIHYKPWSVYGARRSVAIGQSCEAP